MKVGAFSVMSRQCWINLDRKSSAGRANA
ncbi:hypothetical protein [Agrobacterium sp. MA01]